MVSRGRLRRLFLAPAVSLIAGTGLLAAATYLPLSDAELARRSPLIVRAEVVSRQVRHVPLPDSGGDSLETATTLRVLEAIRGATLAPGDTFELALPGGLDGASAYTIPGTPVFAVGGETILFLATRRDGGFSLTELGLSKFDVVADAEGRRFAVRPVFSDAEDDRVSTRTSTTTTAAAAAAHPDLPAASGPRELRDAASFLATLRAAPAGATAPPTLYASPKGELASMRRAAYGADAGAAAAAAVPGARRPLWSNIGGVEGTGPQFRWYWDTGLSPAALVSASGVQTGLSDGSNGISAVQNGATQWSAVAGATVRYATASGSAPVVVHLDVDSESGAWTDPLSCTSGGIIGYGGPGSSRSAPTFRGDGDFFAPSSGNVWMRKVTGGCYSAATFRTAVLHELGHTLGLGHSDDPPSVHSTTTAADHDSAVMHSVLPASHPSTPQTDDIEAIQYYYGNGGTVTPPPPVAAFTFAPSSPVAGAAVTFTDTSTGAPAAWVWTFGDGASSIVPNPTHMYAAAGSYSVTVTASNAGGSSSASRTVPVAPGGAGTAPSAGFSFSPAAPAPGSSVQFQDSSTASPTSWQWSFGDPGSGNVDFSVLKNPAHAFAAAGTYTVVLTVANATGAATTSHLVTVAGCGAGSLCLNGGRFRVTATWSVPTQGTSGVATPVALTGDTGYFWFFTSNNVELVVKVVDGRALNQRFWFFSGALSDVEYTVFVTDTVTGAQRAYFNPQGTLESLADTSAFAPSTTANASESLAAFAAAGGPSFPPPPGPAGPSEAEAPAEDLRPDAESCAVSASALCLNAGRFRVQVAWVVPAQGTSGSGVAVPLTADTGYFWFFSPNNVEIVIKVVDGRAFNGRFWLFSGALSDVGYTITVTDTSTGTVRRYTNPSGSLTSAADVSAF